MRFFINLFILGLAALATSNSVHFVNQDATIRTIVFTPSEGSIPIESIQVSGHGTADQSFPHGWTGNWYSVSENAPEVPGMLGEVRFEGFADATYFDVSAIVNPFDHDGVKEIFPSNSPTPVSGCQSFPCENAYNQADDLRTVSTKSKDLICLLGTVSKQRKRGAYSRVNQDSLDM